MPSFRIFAAVSILMLALASTMVWSGGGWSADAAGDPDEPAHAVTSLMVRDFLVSGTWTHPGAFAEEYYENFPKIALGHYPPGYYVVAGAALLVSPKIGVLLGLQVLLLAGLGVLVFAAARKMVGAIAALCAAFLTLLLPLMWRLSLHVMADLLLVCLCLLAILCWARFCKEPRKRYALGFGVLAALAILTKGSGLMLAVVPPLVVVLQQDWRMLRRLAWWCAPVPVVLLAAPWMALTAGKTKEGMTGQTTLEFLDKALFYYRIRVPEELGYVWLALAGLGLLVWLYRAARKSLGALEASLLASMAGGIAIILLVPAGVSERYLAPMVPTLAILAVVGAGALSRWLPVVLRPWAVVALAAATLMLVARVPGKMVSGYSDAVEYAQSISPSATMERWLVSSDPIGEGGIIVEAAYRLPERSPSPLRVYRGGKELASSDWMRRDYKLAFATEAEMLAHLDEIQVNWVFVDLSVPETFKVPHEKLLESALSGSPDRWVMERRQPITRQRGLTGELLVYRSVARSPKPAP